MGDDIRFPPSPLVRLFVGALFISDGAPMGDDIQFPPSPLARLFMGALFISDGVPTRG
jgi:hypothetical protein